MHSRSHEYDSPLRDYVPQHMYKKATIAQLDSAYIVTEVLDYTVVGGVPVVVVIANQLSNPEKERYVVSRADEFRII